MRVVGVAVLQGWFVSEVLFAVWDCGRCIAMAVLGCRFVARWTRDLCLCGAWGKRRIHMAQNRSHFGADFSIQDKSVNPFSLNLGRV